MSDVGTTAVILVGNFGCNVKKIVSYTTLSWMEISYNLCLDLILYLNMMITDSLFCYKELMSTKTLVLLAHTTSPPFSQDTHR